MNSFQRLVQILVGAFLVLYGVACLSNTTLGLLMAGILITLVLTLKGLKSLWQYFTMARNMVNGNKLLFLGIILTDAGVFAFISLRDGRALTSLYLIGYLIFSGAVKLLQALSSRYQGAPWKMSLVQGLVSLVAVVLCIAYFKSPDVITVIFSVVLIASGLTRIASAFQTTDIVYIQ